MPISTIQNASLASGVPNSAAIGTGTITQTNIATGVAGTGPAILILSGTFAVSSGSNTLCQYSSSQIDTASRFNPTGSTSGGIPAYAFMPNVAGYYQINATLRNQTTSTSDTLYLKVYKNGSGYYNYIGAGNSNPSNYATASGSLLVNFNGTTDYIQIYAYSSAATSLYEGMLSASLVRSA